MPANFKIEVLDKNGPFIKLKTTIIHADQRRFYDTGSAALVILYEGGEVLKQPECPLLQAISIDNIQDPAWVFSYEFDFIKKVSISDVCNFPPDKSVDFAHPDYKKLPSAILSIEVRDEKWIEHTSEVSVWLSSAYDAEAYF